MQASSMEGALIKAEELISLTDLLFRWPYEPTVKILKAIQSKSLYLIQVESGSNAISKKKEIRIRYFHERLMPELFFSCSAKFNYLAFFIRDVEAVENKFGHYQVVPDPLNLKYEFDFCTVKNIHRIAPQVLYTLLCFPYDHFANRVKIDEMLYSEDIVSPYAVIDFKKTKKHDWRIPHSRLWANFNLPNPAMLIDEQLSEEDYKSLDYYLQDKRNKGLLNNEILLALISEYVGFLKNEELGALIPAKPSTKIHADSIFKQGVRLRKRLSTLDVTSLLKNC